MNLPTTSMVTFETALGRCAVRWSDAGITGVLLPTRTGRRGPAFEDGADVPPFVRGAIEGMVAVMTGEARDLRHEGQPPHGINPPIPVAHKPEESIGRRAGRVDLPRAEVWPVLIGRREQRGYRVPPRDRRSTPPVIACRRDRPRGRHRLPRRTRPRASG